MLRIVLFLATNIAVVVVLGFAITALVAGGLLPPSVLAMRGSLLVVAAVVGVGGSLLSLLLSRQLALWSTGARVIDSPETVTEAWLLRTVHDLAARSGVTAPDVAIFEGTQPNAFATGWHRDKGLVAVSTGLLAHMDEGEITAVLAHELAHIANGDMVTLALLQGVLNTFVFLASRLVGSVVDRFLTRDERGFGPGYWVTTLVAELVLGVLATIVVMAFSRWREYRADAGAQALVGTQPMVAALQSLRVASHTELPGSLRAFGLHNDDALSRLFASHPPLEQRIARLLHRHRHVTRQPRST